MGNIRRETRFKCFNDCQMRGCPSHLMTLHIQTTSESLIVDIDGRRFLGADPSEWDALKKLIEESDYNQFDLTPTNKKQ